MLLFKKLMYFLFIGSFIFNCFPMEHDDIPQAQQGNQLSLLTPNNQQNTKIPMCEIKTWDELVKAKEWQTDYPLNQDRQKMFFNFLPDNMKIILEEFANEEACPYLYRRALILAGPRGITSITPFAIAKHFKNISSVFLSADSLIEEQQNLTTNINHLFNLAKQEKRNLLITIDNLNLLFEQNQSANSADSLISQFLQEANKLKKSSIFVILTTNKIQSFPKSITDHLNAFNVVKSSPIQTHSVHSETETSSNPFEQSQTLDELIERMRWKTKKSMKEGHEELIFKILPSTMKFCLGRFANPARRLQPYMHALILEGASGTGKSIAIFSAAKHFNLPLVFIRAASLNTGENSEDSNISHLIRLAKKENKPILIVIEEIDSLLNQLPNCIVLDTLLHEIDFLRESQVFVILTVNKFVNYSDRFMSQFNNSHRCKMPNTTEDSRRSIIEHLIEKHLFEETIQEDLKKYLIQQSVSFNYREIKSLFQEAVVIAQENLLDHSSFESPTKEHFDLAYQNAISRKPFTIFKGIQKIFTLCKNHYFTTGIGLTAIALAIKYYNRK